MALAREEEDAGYALACQAVPESDLTIRLVFDDVEPVAATSGESTDSRHARVWDTEQLAHDVRRIILEPPQAGFAYRTGQYLDLVLPDRRTRGFAMVSAPSGGVLAVHIRQVPGRASPEGIAPNLGPGDEVTIASPYGQSAYRGDDGRLPVFIAGGTGLDPGHLYADSFDYAHQRSASA